MASLIHQFKNHFKKKQLRNNSTLHTFFLVQLMTLTTGHPKIHLNISQETGAHKTQAPTTGTHNLKQFQTATQ